MKKGQGIEKVAMAALLFGSILLAIKMLFTGFVTDESYHIAMSMRHVNGDRLFMEMWEPHQTSAFLTAFLIKVFKSFSKDNTYLVLFLKGSGLLIHIIVSLVLYKVLREFIDKFYACIIGFVFFASTPKLSFIPDFSNMQLWFVTLSLCFLWKAYSFEWKRYIFTILSASFLAAAIISYPTGVILSVIYLLFFLLIPANRNLKAFGVFFLTLVAEGVAYLIAIFSKKEVTTVLRNIGNMVTGDEFHAKGVNLIGKDNFSFILLELLQLIILSILILLVSVLLLRIFGKNRDKKERLIAIISCSMVLSFLVTLYYVYVMDKGFDVIKPYFFLIPMEILMLFIMKKNLEKEERFLLFAVGVGIGVYTSVMVVSNLTLIYNLPFLGTSFIFALASMAWFYKEKKGIVAGLLITVAILTIGTNGYTQKSQWSGTNIFDYNAIVKSGPVKGIRTDWMLAQQYLVGNGSFNDVVKTGDRVLVISDNLQIPATEFYYAKDVEVCQYSTISTPSYGERYIDYFDEFPNKMPDILIIEKCSMEYAQKLFLFNYLIGNCDIEIACEDEYYIFYKVN